MDTFTTQQPSPGNPAGVVLLDQFPDDEWTQGVANELHQAEPAFLVSDCRPNTCRSRWFASIAEVALRGNATLASAH